MKKKMAIAILLGVFFLIGNSWADLIPIYEGQWIQVNRTLEPLPPLSFNGGPFTITGPQSPSTGTSFSFFTFCIEYNEYISLGSNYYVGDISHNVISGGLGDNPNTPPSGALSYAAAKLYSDWLSLSDKNNATTNIAYQQAIWFAEGEIGSVSGQADTLYQGALGAMDYNGVYVVNLMTGPNGSQSQSMLVKDPVPEPVSMLLFGTGLVAAGGYVRRRFKK